MKDAPRPAAEKVVALETLVQQLAAERRAGRKVVFTNGCYDLLHVGHLRLLETAAGLGDRLVVGVNDDASVARLKGAGRPYTPFRERAELLAGLEVVDWVVGFDADTPAALIEALLPEVLVKGGDWSVDRIIGRDTVEAHGGAVLSIPLVPGRSTTSLIERIRSSHRGDDSSGPRS
jgi:D-beta-D-heptose 7-phosphate kinase/D-beta-D-heptose 1-phosphate adenosyltransferase